MDVRLPSGIVMKGVPDGASKADIQSKAIANGLATEQDFMSTTVAHAPIVRDIQPESTMLGDLGEGTANVLAGGLAGVHSGAANLMNIPADIAQSATNKFGDLGAIHPSALWDESQPFYTSETQPEDYQRFDPTVMQRGLEGMGLHPYEPMKNIAEMGTGIAAMGPIGVEQGLARLGGETAAVAAPVVRNALASFATIDPDVDTILGTFGVDSMAKEQSDSPFVKRMKNAADSVAMDSVMASIPGFNTIMNQARVKKLQTAAKQSGKQIEEASALGEDMFSSLGNPDLTAMERYADATEAKHLMNDPVSQIVDEAVTNPAVTVGNVVDLQARFKNAAAINRAGGKIGVATVKDTTTSSKDAMKILGINETVGEQLGGFLNKKLGNTASEILGLRETGLTDARVKAFDTLVKDYNPSKENLPLYTAIKDKDFELADTLIANKEGKTLVPHQREGFEVLKGLKNYGAKVVNDKSEQNAVLEAVSKIGNIVRPVVAFGSGHGALEASRYVLSKWNTTTIGDRVKLINAALNDGKITQDMLEGRVGSFLLKPTVRTTGHGLAITAGDDNEQ